MIKFSNIIGTEKNLCYLDKNILFFKIIIKTAENALLLGGRKHQTRERFVSYTIKNEIRQLRYGNIAQNKSSIRFDFTLVLIALDCA